MFPALTRYTGNGSSRSSRSRCSYTSRGSQPVSAKIAQSGFCSNSPCAAMSASAVLWTPAPRLRTRRSYMIITPPSCALPLVPGRWYGGDPAGRRRRPKTARRRNSSRRHCRRRRLALVGSDSGVAAVVELEAVFESVSDMLDDLRAVLLVVAGAQHHRGVVLVAGDHLICRYVSENRDGIEAIQVDESPVFR